MYALVVMKLDEDANPTDVTSAVVNTPGVTHSQIQVQEDTEDFDVETAIENLDPDQILE